MSAESAPTPQQALFSLITGLHPNGPANGPATAASDWVVGDAIADADTRLAVYAHMYHARLVEALESQFPHLARWLTAEPFADLVRGFVMDHPSRNPSLRELGRGFAPWLASRHPAAAALAELEWARADVFDPFDESVASVDQIRAWPVDRFADLPLKRIEASRLVTVDFKVAALWDASSESSESSDAAAIAERETLLVWRQDVAVYHRPVDSDERRALVCLEEGTTLGLLCEALATLGSEDEVGARVFSWLWTWVSDGLILDPAAPSPV